MKFIEVSLAESPLNKYVINIDQIEFISDVPKLGNGSLIFLKNKPEPLKVDETAHTIYKALMKSLGE